MGIIHPQVYPPPPSPPLPPEVSRHNSHLKMPCGGLGCWTSLALQSLERKVVYGGHGEDRHGGGAHGQGDGGGHDRFQELWDWAERSYHLFKSNADSQIVMQTHKLVSLSISTKLWYLFEWSFPFILCILLILGSYSRTCTHRWIQIFTHTPCFSLK